MTNPLRALQRHVEQRADRLHADADAQALAQGFTVQRLPWGSRRYAHPAVSAALAARAAVYRREPVQVSAPRQSRPRLTLVGARRVA